METDSGQEGGRGIRWRIRPGSHQGAAAGESERNERADRDHHLGEVPADGSGLCQKKIEFYVPGKEECYTAILTAEDQEAPPIILWDTEENRNPFSWYVYSGGSTPSRWNLLRGYVEVTGVTLQPNLWQPGYEHRGASVIFILNGAKDRDRRSTGLALFPEVLKSGCMRCGPPSRRTPKVKSSAVQMRHPPAASGSRRG